MKRQEYLLAEQMEQQDKAKEELEKQREEMRREREQLVEQYERCERLVKQLSFHQPTEDTDSSPKSRHHPVIPPRLHKFSITRLFKSLRGGPVYRDNSCEGPLPSKLGTPGHHTPRSTRRLNSSPVQGFGRKPKHSSMTMSLSRLDGKRTPSPDKRKSLPIVTRGHRRHGSDDLRHAEGEGVVCLTVCDGV